ncbi:unnamed protein product [Mucor hiemalis]
MWLSDSQKIGVGILSFGIFFMLLGVITFFDSGLLAIGNILFVIGIVLTVGYKTAFGYFTQKSRLRGTICLLVGIVLVLSKWCFFGMIIEIFGVLNLFGNYFPVILSFLRRLPVIGPLFNNPTLNNAVDRMFSKQSLPV